MAKKSAVNRTRTEIRRGIGRLGGDAFLRLALAEIGRPSPRRRHGRKQGAATYKIDAGLLPILPAWCEHAKLKMGLKPFPAVKWLLTALRDRGYSIGASVDAAARRLLYEKVPAGNFGKSTYFMFPGTGYYTSAGSSVSLPPPAKAKRAKRRNVTRRRKNTGM